MSQPTQKLLTLFNIQPGEGKLVGPVLLYGILLYTANVLARTAAYALFLTEFDAAALPYAYVGIAIFATLVSSAILKLNERFSLSRVLLGIHLFLLLTLAGYWLGAGLAPGPVLLFSLPVYFGVNNTLTISSFWNLLGRMFNLQQGKRLFGLLSASEHIATIATGFAAPLLVLWVGTANLFLLASVVMIVTVALLGAITKTNAAKMAEPAGETGDDGAQQSTGSLFKDSYVRLIIGLFALFIVGVYFVDTIFYSQAELRYPSEDELAAFIGVFFGVFGVLSLFVQVFVAGRVLTRFGVRAMLLATPLGLLLLVVPFALFGTFTQEQLVLFWLIVAANMYRSVLDAVDSAAVNVMYQPLPARRRTQAQTTVIGIVYPLSIGFTGLALLFLIDILGFGPVQLSYVLLVILIAWLATALALGRAYPIRLRQALRKRSLGGMFLPRPDRSSLAVFQAGLASPHVGVVLYSLNVLDDIAPETMPDYLPGLLEHPTPEVREEALRRIRQLNLAGTLPAVSELLNREPAPQVRAEALRTLAALDPAGAIDQIYPYLEAADPVLRQSAIVGLLQNGSVEVTLLADRQVLQLANSLVPADRLLAAQVIGEVAAPNLQQLLGQLLQDDNFPVRRAALAAAGQAAYPQLWPRVTDGLARPETRGAAAAALVTGGEAARPAIEAALNQPDQQREVAMQLAQVCGRIGGDQVIALLVDRLDTPDDGLRARILAALGQCGYQAAGTEQAMIRQQISGETDRAAVTLAALVDLDKLSSPNGSGQALSLLTQTLNHKLAQHQANIFELLTFLYNPETIRRAWDTLRPGAQSSAEQRAYALEIIDVTLDQPLKAQLVPLLSERPLPDRLKQLGGAFPQPGLTPSERVRALLAAPGCDPWLAACALFAAGRPGLDDDLLRQTVEIVSDGEPANPLVKETAAGALARFKAGSTTTAPAGTAPLSTVEKVIALNQAGIFAETPADVLANAAGFLTEVTHAAGEPIIHKGDEGDCMYIIVAGRVRVHDQTHLLNHLAAGDVFGEMALLEPQPRTASVTTEVETRLLRLDQQPFIELIEERSEVARGIIRVLSRHLRGSVEELLALRGAAGAASAAPAGPALETEPTLTLIEKIMTLKRVDLFSGTPDNVLAEIAASLHELLLPAGQSVFQKGNPGDCMYLIVAGEVRVHDGPHTLNHLTGGDVFGEMALLDSEPRLASVTALAETRLLRLDQAPFFEIMEARPEVARGVIRVLAHHLRNRIRDISQSGVGLVTE